MVSGGAVKERKGWESSGKRRETGELGRKTPASIQGPRVSLGRAAAVTAFQVVTVESWSQTYKLQQFEQKEGWDLR
jgi:hypothetical protein